MRHITAADIQAFEKVYRLNLVNGLPGFKPAIPVVFCGLFPVDADDTYTNLKSSGCYTLNHVPVALAAQAHYTSADFPDTVSEFDACGFTAVYRDDFPAPYVAESQLSIGLRLLEEHHISNGTVLLVGLLNYVPALALGPVVEHLMLWSGK